jgi:hypothetical protein
MIFHGQTPAVTDGCLHRIALTVTDDVIGIRCTRAGNILFAIFRPFYIF